MGLVSNKAMKHLYNNFKTIKNRKWMESIDKLIKRSPSSYAEKLHHHVNGETIRLLNNT